MEPVKTSAVEQELAGKIASIRTFMLRHDRFVLITLGLSLSPSPLAPILSVLLVIYQLRLIKKGSLAKEELSVLIVSLIISLINIMLVAFMVHNLKPTYTSSYIYIKDLIKSLLTPWFWFNRPLHTQPYFTTL